MVIQYVSSLNPVDNSVDNLPAESPTSSEAAKRRSAVDGRLLCASNPINNNMDSIADFVTALGLGVITLLALAAVKLLIYLHKITR
jgi:hypothetical protein